jgi:hypothetical protein
MGDTLDEITLLFQTYWLNKFETRREWDKPHDFKWTWLRGVMFSLNEFRMQTLPNKTRTILKGTSNETAGGGNNPST